MRYAIDVDDMAAKCDRLQWKVSDFDWDAPKAQVDPRVASLIAEVYWIESVASLVFAGMAKQTDEPALRRIFESFSADEQRHADAELALLRHWGSVKKNEMPAPNINARNLLATLRRVADRVHPAVYAAIIPMTELVLDGALVREVTQQVKDPLCAAVFQKINADEARHLAVDFYMLERFGAEDTFTWQFVLKNFLDAPRLFGLLFGYVPMLARARPFCEAAGIDHAKVTECFSRYSALGDNSDAVRRHPMFQVNDRMARQFARTGRTRLGDALLYLSDIADAAGVRPYL